MLDIDALLQPVPGEKPVGENTEYTGLNELERLATGTPGTLNPETQEYEGAEEPDWRKVRTVATELLGQTKDIRVSIILTRSLLALAGLKGAGQGLALTARLLSDYWDDVYPELDREEDNDPIERMNALANLADPEGFIPMLRRAVVAESRQVGRYTVRDLDYATGRLAHPDPDHAPSLTLLNAALSSAPEDNAQHREGAQEAFAALQSIEQVFREKAGQAPNLDGLKQALRRIKEFHESQASPAAADAPAAAGPSGEPGAVVPVAMASPHAIATSGAGPLATRSDAVRLLMQVSEFLRKTEPSSPAPMFLDRAVKLLQMDFEAIVRELMPQSKEHIELVGGISLEPPASDDGY